MSPRRRVQPGEQPLLPQGMPKTSLWSRMSLRQWKLPRQWWKPSRQWVMPLAMTLAVLVAAGAITASSFILVNHRKHHELAMKEVDVLGFARSFMTSFTSLDPFHANAYVDRILANGTGDFAKQYRDKVNEVLLNVAQAEPTKGTALDAGVERWNDDGSASVLVATEVTYKTPDGKQTIESTNRWVLTAQREGDQWKISSLQQVI
ncbi:mammalian cell entry protein [Mycobacterium branderi]|uniref:Mammalian cell entry protein n=2 Tax=Mycobacterium branderi TaxID=43348 RepID=A0AA91RGT4_9MYCO|nr:mammalian cell entry protein [Mycobacterium branderi]MCV7235476.1 mammalian cell entry protein [Mycobacterium branderi]ORA34350.1 mammalian cell entry protein [Mycobacterium branderi]